MTCINGGETVTTKQTHSHPYSMQCPLVPEALHGELISWKFEEGL